MQPATSIQHRHRSPSPPHPVAALLAEWPEHAGGFEREPGCLSVRLETADSGRIAIVEPGPDWLVREGWN